MPQGSIMYVPVSEFSKLPNGKINLSTNFFSFGEMRKQIFLEYINSNFFKKSDISFLVNRFVSSPFFEKTYDSDLNIMDYSNLGRDITYFDIFPIHHFFLNKRLLFTRKFYRNLSSPYFEMVTTKQMKNL